MRPLKGCRRVEFIAENGGGAGVRLRKAATCVTQRQRR
jgi:hypothetical protein